MIFTQILSDDDCVSEITVQSSKSPPEDKDKGIKTIIVKGSTAKVKIIYPKNFGGSIVENWSASDTLWTTSSVKWERICDLAAMHTDLEFKRKKQILLWIKCLTKPKKRPRPESADGCPRPK